MKHQIRNTIAAMIAAGSAASFAADNSASDTSLVTLAISKHIQLVGLDSIPLGTADPATDTAMTGSDAFCIGGTGFSLFKLSISGATATPTGGDTNAFYLNGSTDTIPYSVTFANAKDGTGASGVNNGQEYAGYSRQIANCGAAGANDNAQLAVSVGETDWKNAEGTTYQDTLTVLVTAQ